MRQEDTVLYIHDESADQKVTKSRIRTLIFDYIRSLGRRLVRYFNRSGGKRRSMYDHFHFISELDRGSRILVRM